VQDEKTVSAAAGAVSKLPLRYFLCPICGHPFQTANVLAVTCNLPKIFLTFMYAVSDNFG